MNVEEKIFYYYQIKWNIPFRELYHTVLTVSDIVKPICPNIETLKYMDYFFAEIDFDKIGSNTDKAETLKYCNAIHYGLEHLLKADISKAIHIYQSNILALSKEQIQETQIKLIGLIGSLKTQTRTNIAGISFTQRYNALYKRIEVKERLLNIDYQILISHFNETISNDLLSRFEIINETFKEITPVLKALPTQRTEAKAANLKVKQIALIHFYEGKQITRENAGEIAAKHGYIAKNSGEGLFQDYSRYCSTANRKGKPTPCTSKTLMNKIELFESVINHLSDNKKQRAIDEINILKAFYENEYQ
jgi:hypothetical protein